ncbi:MAG: (Fe-S)-binding protein [Bacteroidetes bacterium]|nr:(Fe-S)-binding protein [Bacteroidota bacterium]
MTKQILFIVCLIATLGVFSFTIFRLYQLFKLTKKFPIGNYGKRFGLMLEVAIGQTKIFRKPVIGFVHALVFWGFLVILIGSIEMIVDGLFGIEKSLAFLGMAYNIIFASGDVFALIILIAIILFLGRRAFLNIKRFSGIEMTHKSHLDAYIALTIILLLMVSLLGMNTFYVVSVNQAEIKGLYPVSTYLAGLIGNGEQYSCYYEFFWWMHILLIFFFANMLPYSKHFHVFLSVPNVFLSRLDPLGKLPNMDSITQEIKSMMNPETAFAAPTGEVAPPERFGVKDVEDVTWKNYFDSLSCTQCGRCTSVCPANITGKKLSPRKVMMDLRYRMNEKGPQLVKNGKDYTDNKSLLKDCISVEEIWACTTCNACAQECPININHPTLIVEMRRYLVMEESAAPGGLNSIFTNIENNGAPWQFSAQDRLLWTNELYIKG